VRQKTLSPSKTLNSERSPNTQVQDRHEESYQQYDGPYEEEVDEDWQQQWNR